MAEIVEVPQLNEATLREKIKRSFKQAGREVIKLVLTLLYCMQDSDTPLWARATIIGSLLYFISPVDAIPDFLPGGYVDDLAVLGSATAVVVAYIKPEHRARAQEWVDETFGPEDAADDE